MPQPTTTIATDQVIFYNHLKWISDNINLTPTQITLANVPITTLTLYFFYQHKIIPFLLLFTLRYFLDCLDGYHARNTDQCTEFGDRLDHAVDFLFFAIIFLIRRNFMSSIPLLIFIVSILNPNNLTTVLHDNGYISLNILFLLEWNL